MQNEAGCFTHTRLQLPSNGTVLLQDAEIYMRERKAQTWTCPTMQAQNFREVTDVPFCPEPEGSAFRLQKRRNLSWPIEKTDRILDEALSGLENNGRPRQFGPLWRQLGHQFQGLDNEFSVQYAQHRAIVKDASPC